MTRGAKSGTFTHVLIPSSWTFDPNAFMATRGRECQAYLRELLQSQMFHQIKSFTCGTLSVPSCHATRRKHGGGGTARLPRHRQGCTGQIRTTDLLFIESRLAELNSDLGMIHQDDFEDCISRVPSHVRSNLSDLLERGRRGFGRLAT
ncbi:hypothetical protein T265_15094, partial [Opisthorchis viverrini]